MRYRHSLRFRIIVSFLILGGLISPLLAVFVFVSLYQMEESLIEQRISEELEHFRRLAAQDPALVQQRSSRMSVYRLAPGAVPAELDFVEGLAPGFGEVEIGDKEYYVGMERYDGTRYVAVYDITEFEQREHFLIVVLMGAILGAVYLSVWVGYSLSRRLIAPVTSLARQVAALRPEQSVTYLSEGYPDDEVGSLARAFDAYSRRIHDFVRRERDFTADASHELRNPLAVVQSSAELLLSQDGLSDRDKARVERIHRATREMSRNLEALLILAREADGASDDDTTDVAALVEHSLELERAGLACEGVTVELSLEDRPRVAAAPSVVGILTGNLIRNALAYTPEGRVDIHLDAASLTVSDTGVGIPGDQLDKVFQRGFRGRNALGQGSGLGLSIAKRICDRCGWTLTVDSGLGGTRVQWRFAAPEKA